MKQIKTIFLAVLAALSPACGQSASHHAQAGDSLLTIREQGSFLIGGTVKTQPGTYDTRHPLRADGQTLHGDHAYVSYQIPADARRIPLVFLHGAGQSAKTWESTPNTPSAHILARGVPNAQSRKRWAARGGTCCWPTAAAR